jgi:uncharacterized protein
VVLEHDHDHVLEPRCPLGLRSATTGRDYRPEGDRGNRDGCSLPDHPLGVPQGTQAPLRGGYARVADSVRRMKQAVSLITLGVSDYERAKSFYESLGWTVALDIEETAFFQANSVVLVLWGRDKLAADSGLHDEGASWGGIALAHNVGSRKEVDQVIEQARASGATVTREPAETFYGGYAGVFRDLDGHAWEIAHNPGFGLAPDGSLILR